MERKYMWVSPTTESHGATVRFVRFQLLHPHLSFTCIMSISLTWRSCGGQRRWLSLILWPSRSAGSHPTLGIAWSLSQVHRKHQKGKLNSTQKSEIQCYIMYFCNSLCIKRRSQKQSKPQYHAAAPHPDHCFQQGAVQWGKPEL